MRKLLIGIAVLFVLLVVAVVALPFLVPKDALVARLEREVTERTGHRLEVSGPVDVSVIPNLAVTMRDVRFAGFEGGAALAALDRLDVRLALWPLLSGEVRVDRFVLVEPVIALEVDAKGRTNWAMKPQAPAQPQSDGGGAASVQEVVLGDVEIVDGRVTYTDRRAGTTRTVENLDATVGLEGLDRPFVLDAEMELDGRPVTVEALAQPARALIEGGSAEFTTQVAAAGARLELKGVLERPTAGDPSVAGNMALAVGDLPALLAWAGGTEPAALPVKSLSLTSGLRASPKQVALSGMKLQADEIAATGDLGVALGGARPAVKGKLAVSALDLDALMPPAGGAAAPAPSAPPPEGGSPSPAAEGWSREPIDLSALRTVDADVDISLAGVKLAGVETGATALSLDLNDGRLRTALADTAVFGGTVKGEAAIDSRAAMPGWRVNAAVQGVQAEPVLKRFAQFDKLTGTTEGKVDLRMAGASVYDLMRTMDGEGALLFRDGAIRGVNIAGLVRSVTGGASEGPQQTDFAEMGGTFQVRQGTASNEDFRLIAPLLRVGGGGKVFLPDRRVDFRIVPRLVASIQGQGAAEADQRGLSVPILIQGTFENLSFKPDLAAIATETLKDPAAVKEQIQGVRDAVRGAGENANPGQAVEGLLKGLLGGQRQQQQPPPPPSTAPQQGGQ